MCHGIIMKTAEGNKCFCDALWRMLNNFVTPALYIYTRGQPTSMSFHIENCLRRTISNHTCNKRLDYLHSQQNFSIILAAVSQIRQNSTVFSKYWHLNRYFRPVSQSFESVISKFPHFHRPYRLLYLQISTYLPYNFHSRNLLSKCSSQCLYEHFWRYDCQRSTMLNINVIFS